MINKEKINKDFSWGISVLNAYVRLNNIINYYDINIASEGLFCNLINILYSLNLRKIGGNNAGYDLISENEKIILQVSSSFSTKKINFVISY